MNARHARPASPGQSRRDPRGSTWSLLRVVAAVTALLASASMGARLAAAQDSPWQFAVTPYLWGAGITGSTDTRASPVHVDVDFHNILRNLSGLPLMLGGEVRKGPVGVVLDLIWLRVSSDIDTRNLLFNDGKARLSTVQASATGLYRVIDQPAGTLDIGAGLRLWSVSTKASLNPGLLPGVSARRDKTFADPILAVRFDFRLGGRWSLTAYGDVGGFGISSDVTWQALGTLNYRAADWLDVRLGWRHLAVDRKKIELDLSGPLLAATFRF